MTDMPDLTDRATFQHWVSHTIRYNDQDPVGHVNNAAMATFLEQGRTMFVYPLMRKYADETLEIVLARVVIDYLKEVHFPGTVDIGSRVAHVGNKSLTLVHGVFKSEADVGECVTTGECTLVFFDKIGRTSTVPPSHLRDELVALMQS